MCGIAGILRLDGGPVQHHPLEAMVDALAHRGPDGSGIHVSGQIGLGHRRLSILDPTEAGAQPMRRGGTLLVHNGEIYNFLELADELRDQGEAIVTGTDTEVILAAYRVWGPDAVQRFNGMFAFALWDDDRRRLLLPATGWASSRCTSPDPPHARVRERADGLRGGRAAGAG